MNRERFAKLSPDVQSKVRRIVGDNMPLITKAMADDEDDLTRKFADGGMTVTIGRLRRCPVLDYKFVALGHNTIRGAAGVAILNAELMHREGLL